MYPYIDSLLEKEIIDQKKYDELICYNDRLTSMGIPVIYNLRHVRKIFHIKKRDQEKFFGKDRNQLYHKFAIPKKSGGYREIEAPCDELKSIQRWIKDEIVDRFVVSQFATGFRQRYSIVENAQRHVGKDLVINMDLKEFFPSVQYSEVFRMFCYAGYRRDVAHLLTKLCTNSDNRLPQGSPASPSISNHVLLKLDKRLGKFAESIEATYSRYADDITFSGKKGIVSIVPIVTTIIEDEGYCVNEKKTRFQYKNHRQEVTGIIVNDKLGVSSKIEDELRNAIYYIDKFGLSSHMEYIKCNKLFYKDHLYGIAYFIKMVEKEKGQKYLERLDDLNWD